MSSDKDLTDIWYRMRSWEEKFLAADHSDDLWCLEHLRRGEKDQNGTPLLFSAAAHRPTFEFLVANGVDLFQRKEDGSTILSKFEKFDTETYAWLCKRFQSREAIDLAEEEGLTPLSGAIKAGDLVKAKILIEHGASMTSAATLSRYGGTRLDIMTQALLSKGGAEDAAIEALRLMKGFGFQPTASQLQSAFKRIGDRKPKLKAWLLDNFGDAS